jgi:hypothetical protein
MSESIMAGSQATADRSHHGESMTRPIPSSTTLMPWCRTLAAAVLVAACGVLVAPLGVIVGILILWLAKLPRPGKGVIGVLTLVAAVRFVDLSGWFTVASSGGGGS